MHHDKRGIIILGDNLHMLEAAIKAAGGLDNIRYDIKCKYYIMPDKHIDTVEFDSLIDTDIHTANIAREKKKNSNYFTHVNKRDIYKGKKR